MAVIFEKRAPPVFAFLLIGAFPRIAAVTGHILRAQATSKPASSNSQFPFHSGTSHATCFMVCARLILLLMLKIRHSSMKTFRTLFHLGCFRARSCFQTHTEHGKVLSLPEAFASLCFPLILTVGKNWAVPVSDDPLICPGSLR